jgi:hypothetical protein
MNDRQVYICDEKDNLPMDSVYLWSDLVVRRTIGLSEHWNKHNHGV